MEVLSGNQRKNAGRYFHKIVTVSKVLVFSKFVLSNKLSNQNQLIMKRIFLSFTICLLAVLSGYGQDLSSEMYDLAKIRNNVKNKRVSSYDKTGNNNDRLTGIKDGDKVTIFDVKGAGIINHIWITIAPAPETLSRNDIILRMYWDGKSYPSVESPIGDRKSTRLNSSH